MRLSVRKHRNTLVPVDDYGVRILSKVKQDEIVCVEFRRPRNERQNRLYWALMEFVSEHSKLYATPEQVSDALKVATGHVETFVSHKGDVIYKMKSLAFDEMGQDEFDIYFNRCLDILAERFLPMLPADLRREAENMIGLNYGGSFDARDKPDRPDRGNPTAHPRKG